MDLDPELYKQLVDTFQAELDEQLQVIVDNLLLFEKDPSTKNLEEGLHAVFRAAHNIKGAARSLDINDVGDIAHRLEDVFNRCREGNTVPTPAAIDVSLKTVDMLKKAMQSFVSQQEFDKKPTLEQLDELLKNFKMQEPVKTKTVEPEEVKTVVATKVEAQESSDVQAKEYIKVTTDKIDQLSTLSDELQSANIGLEALFSYLSNIQLKLNAQKEIWQKLKDLSKKESLYVDGLDKTAEMQVLALDAYRLLREQHNEISRAITALQDKTRILRLMPAATLIHPLLRTIRDISKDLNKQVEVEVLGEEVEVDRAVLNLLQDPLTHLVRNAIDHGIESADVRSQAGKNAQGKIIIKVEHIGSQIVISVEDDGVGVDVNKVAEAAMRRRLLTKEERAKFSEQELLNLVFQPGVSTKEIITDYSGRGVGLDVVQTNVQLAKGTVRLEAHPGKGSVFTLNVPLTLITDHGLLVRVGSEQFVMPTNSVEHVLEAENDKIRTVESGCIITFQGKSLPVRDLAYILGLKNNKSFEREQVPIVIVSKGWSKVAFIVDEIIGEREIVIKQFQPPLCSIKNISGATLTNRGQVVVVLNTIDLVDSALRAGSRTRLIAGAEEQAKPRILLAEDSLTTRTLEVNVLSAQGYDVKAVVDGKEAWELLHQEQFDLVVTDVVMPNVNGFELTKLIKTDEKLKTIPVIIVTSKDSVEDKKRGVEAGADAYIIKSEFESRALLDIVDQLL
jgi:two-component system, chemotaxis family, sensor kinase CheA